MPGTSKATASPPHGANRRAEAGGAPWGEGEGDAPPHPRLAGRRRRGSCRLSGSAPGSGARCPWRGAAVGGGKPSGSSRAATAAAFPRLGLNRPPLPTASERGPEESPLRGVRLAFPLTFTPQRHTQPSIRSPRWCGSLPQLPRPFLPLFRRCWGRGVPASARALLLLLRRGVGGEGWRDPFAGAGQSRPAFHRCRTFSAPAPLSLTCKGAN